MNKKDIFLLILGVTVGHLLSTYLRIKRENASNQEQSKTGQETLVDPRIAMCEEKWADYSKTKRFGSEEQLNTTKGNFITSCLAKTEAK
jgi:hypothetical protein